MPDQIRWIDVGAAETLSRSALQQVVAGGLTVALSFANGTFAAISGVCNHTGGPLGEGTLDADGYIACPWHGQAFHRETGEGAPGYTDDRVPRHAVAVRDGRVLVSAGITTTRHRVSLPHPLAHVAGRGEPGGAAVDAPWRVLGISTTNMDESRPRFSTSDHLLGVALDHAGAQGCDTQLLRLSSLEFRNCEGYYSKSAHACTWPCSITQMDPNDQLDRVYEAFVQWADVTIISTPIRWGGPSALYVKMTERFNCIQNQQTIANRVLLKDKVAAFLITGGQDNVQAVAGGMLNFFGEIGCYFPQFPYVGHSRGWTAEDMENNIDAVRGSVELASEARALVDRSVSLARRLNVRPDVTNAVEGHVSQ